MNPWNEILEILPWVYKLIFLIDEFIRLKLFSLGRYTLYTVYSIQLYYIYTNITFRIEY